MYYVRLLLISFLIGSSLPAKSNLNTIKIPGILLNNRSCIVPFQLKDGLILITGLLNDSVGIFILDTGAERMVLNKKYFKASSFTNQSSYGLGGSVEGVGKSFYNNLKTDELIIENIEADVVDLSQIEEKKNTRILGLIGYDILKEFEILFNYRDGFVTFSITDKKGEITDLLKHTTDKIDSLDFEYGNFIPVIDVSINGKIKKMGIDTGAEVNLLDTKVEKDVLKEFQTLRSIRVVGADGRKSEALAGRMYRIQVFNKYKCGAMATMLTSLNYLESIYKTNLDGILGYEFLAPWYFSINYKKKKLYLHSFKMDRP